MRLEKYTNKNILILSGGTSTLDVKWENLNADFIWTCNDAYKEDRIFNSKIDLYVISYNTDINDPKLIKLLRRDGCDVVVEPLHYRGKQGSPEFKKFEKKLQKPVIFKNLGDPLKRGARAKAGVGYRMVRFALEFTHAKQILFSGLDGFDKNFSNKHAFTKKVGLKTSDTRRKWYGSDDAYYEVYIDAFNYLAAMDTGYRLQNLGEGFEYNIGTTVSKVYFPLKKEIHEQIR